jgi:hypothetical protein
MITASGSRAPGGSPKAAAAYAPPTSATSGAPSGTASKNVQPTTAEAAGPNASRTKVETPPPPGKRAESRDIVSASGNVRNVIAPQATSEAGPASSAATAGITSTPEPSTAPA